MVTDIRSTTRAEAHFRLEKALEHLQRAQTEVGEALSLVSSVTHVLPQWRALGKLHDQIRAQWYKLNDARQSDKPDLDELSLEAFLKR